MLISFIIISIVVSLLLEQRARKNVYDLAKSNLRLQSQTIDKMLDREHTKMLNQVKSHLKVANHLFYKKDIGFSDNTHEIKIINQISGNESLIKLNTLNRGGEDIYKSTDFTDLCSDLFGGTTTIFQKIDKGFLRISTNVPDDSNQRAVGTFIPNESEVIKTIKRGERYYGRAFVVNDWYITAYEPIYLNSELVGILYVGVIENDLGVLSETINSLKIGKTGYSFIFEKSGEMITNPEKKNAQSLIYQIIEEEEDSGIIESAINKSQIVAYKFNEKTKLYVAATINLSKEVETPVKRFLYFSIITSTLSILIFIAVIFLTTSKRLHRLLTDVEVSKTKLKSTKEELKKTEKNFETIFNQSSDGIFVCDTSGNIIEVNDIVCDVLKYDKADLLSKNITDITADSYKDEQLKKINDSPAKDAIVYESVHLSSDGEFISVEVKSNRIVFKSKEAVICIARNIQERKELEQKLLSAVIQTEDRERERFSKDMHDGLGPMLSTIKMYVNELDDDENSAEEKSDFIKYLNELIDEAITSTRSISNNLLPRIIYEFGLEKAISSFVNKVNKANKLIINFNKSGIDREVNKNTELLIYRIVTELINNTIKHAQASRIDIKLEYEIDNIILEFKDDGKGFDYSYVMSKKKRGLGIKSIQSRVNSLNGKFEIFTKPDNGFSIKIVI